MKTFSKYVYYFGIIILFSVLMGIVGWMYLALSNFLLTALWVGPNEEIAGGFLYNSPFLILGFTVIGAFLFALIQEKFGEYPVKPKFYIADFVERKKIDYRNIFKGFFLAMIPLILGASVGPEASLVGIYFMFYSMSKDIDNHMEKKLKISLVTNSKEKFKDRFLNNPLYALKILILYIVTLAVLSFLSGQDPYAPFYFRIGHAEITINEIILIIPFFVIGYFYTDFYLKVQQIVDSLMNKIPNKRVQITFTGLCIGIVAILFPMTIMSGEIYGHIIIDDLMSKTVISLLLLTFIKILLTHISVSGHIKGGPIYPIMFSTFLFSAAIALLFGADYVFTLATILTVILVRIFKNLIAVFIYLLFFFSPAILLFVFVLLYIAKKFTMWTVGFKENIFKEYDDSKL